MADNAPDDRDSASGQSQYHGVPANALPLTASEDRQWATLAHFGGILGCVPSLLIYLIFRDRGPFTAQESKEALNFTLPPTIAAVLANILVLLPVVGNLFAVIATANLGRADLLLGVGRNPRQPRSAAPLPLQPALDQVAGLRGCPVAGSALTVPLVRKDPADHGIGEQPALQGQDQPSLGKPLPGSTSPSAMRPAIAWRPTLLEGVD